MPQPPAHHGWPDARSVLLAAAVFSALSLAASLTSKDFLETDAIVHYLYSRFAFHQPHLMVDVWGRPVCTIVYALGSAVGGLTGAHVTALILALATAFISYRIAHRLGYRWPALAMIFLLGQPLVFLHSFSVMTELPFAVLVAGALWAYLARRFAVMALLVGLMPATRPEGLGFLLLGAAAILLHRRWASLIPLAIPLLLWSAAGWFLCGRPDPWFLKICTWVPDHWPYSAVSLYDSGPIWHFLVLLPAVVGPGAFPAIFAGAALILAEGAKSQPHDAHNSRLWTRFLRMDHRQRCQWLILILPIGILIVHSLLFFTGRMASSGEPRYLMVTAPMWALLAAKGWEWAFLNCRFRRPVFWAGIAVLTTIFANVIYPVLPRKRDTQTTRAMEVANWYRSSGVCDRYPALAVSHPAVYFFTDVSMHDRKRAAEWHPRTVLAAPQGTVLVWDPLYAIYNSDSNRKIDVGDVLNAGWVPVKVLKEKVAAVKDTAVNRIAQKIQRDEVGRWYIFLSPRDILGQPTTKPATLPVELQLSSER